MGTFFGESALQLNATDLESEEEMSRLATLIDIEPDRYFPKFASLIFDASAEQLRETGGGLGRRGTRRTLVWTAERFAAFPQYFSDAERILRQLALNETEEGVGNNATGVWKELFRIQLSGTATPFADRIRLLKDLSEANSGIYQHLVLDGLKEALNHMGTPIVGPSVVGGQLVPPDWRPRTLEEFRQCITQILEVIEHVTVTGKDDVKLIAWRIIAQHLRFLLRTDFCRILSYLLNESLFLQKSCPFLSAVEDFLEYECNRSAKAAESDANCVAVSEWLAQLTPSSFDDRVRAIVGKDYWHHSMRQDISKQPSEIAPLASEILADPSKLSNILEFLGSRAAPSAGLLGRELGHIDTEGRFLDEILSEALRMGSSAFAGGYIAELLERHPSHSSRFNNWLDRIEIASPTLAHYLGLAAPVSSSPIERSLRLASAGQIDVNLLEHFQSGIFFLG